MKEYARFENLAFGVEEPPDYSGNAVYDDAPF
jgi:hypothetical protein